MAEDRAWILVGMMGAGKSSVGRELATRAMRAFYDTDAMLEGRLCRPISQIFRVYGEPAFRDHETAILRSLEPGPSVVATGGGIVLREANWAELRRLGVVVYLQAGLDDLADRLERSKRRRPLLDAPDWRARLAGLLAEREPQYRRADLVVPLAGVSVESSAEAVFAALKAAS